MNPYRTFARVDRRRSVVSEAKRIRDALVTGPRFHNVAGTVRSSQEIIDALTDCIHELSP